MSNEVINVQQLPKETVAKFVNDAAEMEVSCYSLKETAQQIRKDIAEKRDSTTDQLSYLSNQTSSQEKKSDTVCNYAKSYTWKYHRKLDNTFPKSLVFFFLLCLPVWATLCAAILGSLELYCLIFKISSKDMWANMWTGTELFIYIFAAILYIIIFILISRGINKKRFAEEVSHLYLIVRQENEKLQKCQAEYNNYKLTHSKILKDLVTLEEHAAKLEKSAAEIEAALKKHYSLDIIPPDYRDMVHVLYINRAFRNDQVDTMREATLLCDRDIQHSEVVGGLRKIASAIRSLAPILENISYKISIMNAELKGIADGQNKLLSETESARYATEAVQSSQETLLWYEQQKWYRANQ